MPSRSAGDRNGKAARTNRPRALVHAALRHALAESGASNASAARWMNVNESTLTRWLMQRTPVMVERVLASRRLARHFTACWAVLVGRAARKNGRSHG